MGRSVLLKMLLLMLFLSFTALTEEVSDVFVRADDDVLLNCDKVQDGQDQCERTTWIFSNIRNSNPAEEIITLGRISSGYRHKSHRFTVTQNCSLLIKNVEMWESGRFDCRQFDQSGREVSETSVMLTVVAVTELMDDDDVTLNCNVFSHHRCSTLRVRWIYSDSEVDTDQPDIRKNERICGASLSFHPSYYSGLKGALFECEVTHNNHKHLFKLRPERHNETTTGSPKNNDHSGRTLPDWWWAVAVAVAVVVSAALIISAVVLVRRKRKRKPREIHKTQPSCDPDEAVSYASVTYTKKNEGRVDPRLSEEDTVTYSSVRTPASEDSVNNN